MISYHGTSAAKANSIFAGAIQVDIGGGELGRGFYSGEHLHEAKTWAYQTSGDRKSNTVELQSADDDVEQLKLKLMDAGEAGLHRYRIKKNNETRTFLFHEDMIWAPIVGSEKVSGDQYKWESEAAKSLLNDLAKTQKRVI